VALLCAGVEAGVVVVRCQDFFCALCLVSCVLCLLVLWTVDCGLWKSTQETFWVTQPQTKEQEVTNSHESHEVTHTTNTTTNHTESWLQQQQQPTNQPTNQPAALVCVRPTQNKESRKPSFCTKQRRQTQRRKKSVRSFVRSFVHRRSFVRSSLRWLVGCWCLALVDLTHSLTHSQSVSE